MYQKSPQNPEICHTKSSLTLTRDILAFEYGHQNFFLDYERSTQGLLISGKNLKIAFGETQWLACLDMTEKKLKLPYLPIYTNGDPNFFWSLLDPLGTFRTPQKNLILFY